MSLLWPDRLVGGLFPGQCWLKGNGKEHSRAPVVGEDAATATLAALDGLLDEHGRTMRKSGRVSLVVSDSLAALAPLAWHEHLRTPEEIRAYAKACFQRRGEDLGDVWVMNAAFRHHGAAGLAYALPRVWVDTLAAKLATRGLVLDRVLPLTAQAYWKVTRRAPAGQELLLLCEGQRTGALVYGAGGLLDIDAEAGAGDAQISVRRLLGRISAFYPGMNLVQAWSERSDAERGACPFITDTLTDATLVAVPRSDWS